MISKPENTLETATFCVRQNMWNQHNGAPAHFLQVLREHLNDNFSSTFSKQIFKYSEFITIKN